MSATIHYRVIAEADPYLKTVGSASSLIDALERAFGSFPCKLSEEHIPVLRGMAAVSFKQPCNEIIEIIENFGEIELYATY